MWNGIIPTPRSVDERTEHFVVPDTFLIHAEGPAAADTLWMERVNKAFARLSGRTGDLLRATPSRQTANLILVQYTAPEGSYRLTVESATITLHYAETSALAHGLATLAQAVLLAHDAGKPSLPTAEIEDGPHSAWRGFMLDVARHIFPLGALERVVDVLWLLRLNRFHLHLTDDQGWRLPVADYPRLTEVGAYRSDGTSLRGLYGGWYNVEQLRALDRGASALGIVVVPEIDLPGHASAALTAYPELACNDAKRAVETRWGIFNSTICATKSSTREFLRAIYRSVTTTFAGPYIHIGGDETPTEPWRECKQCKQAADPYQQVVRAMAETAIAEGLRPLVWDEAAALDLPSETIVVNWREAAGAFDALRNGYDVVLSPQHKATYLDHKHADSELEPGRLGVCTVADCAQFAPDAYLEAELAGSSPTAGSVLGGQANLWTEAIASYRQVEYMAIVRLSALAQGLWSGLPAAQHDMFERKLSRFRGTLAHNGLAVYPGLL